MLEKINLRRILILVSLFSLVCESHSQYEEFSQSFDLLSTIAGKGDIDNKGDNGWSETYEGGPAIEAELSRPHMAMADSAGNIYIADKDAHAIRKVNVEGIITTIAGTSVAGDGMDGIASEQALNAPNGVWVNKLGVAYILDLNNDKIRKVDTEGQLTTIVDDDSGISLGRGLWLSKTEDTIWYASGSQIKMWTDASGIIAYATGFSGLGNIIQDPEGNIVATDRSANLVYRVAKDGSKEIIAGNGSISGGGDGSTALETAFYGVRGVWFLADGSYFLGTHEGSQIWYIDTEGIAHLFLNGSEGDSNHSGDGENYQTPGSKVSEARAVTADYQGNVLVTENDRGFIRKIKRSDVDALIDKIIYGNMSLKTFPNPVSDMLRIQFRIATPGNVEILILNQHGQMISHIKNEKMTAGLHETQWQNTTLPVGIYFINLQSGTYSLTQRICITK